jgi:hypothetical protein
MIAPVYPITVSPSLDRGRDFILGNVRGDIRGEGLEIEAGIDADEENHPGKNRQGNEGGDPPEMKGEPACGDEGDRGQNNRPGLAPPGFELPDGGGRGWGHRLEGRSFH